MEDFLKLGVVFLGFLAVVRPMILAREFYGLDTLGNAISFMFLGEAWGFLITVSFALLAFFGFLADVPAYIQAFMRIAMFVPAIVTTHHLAKVCKQMRAEREP